MEEDEIFAQIARLREDPMAAMNLNLQDLEDMIGCVVRNKKAGTLRDDYSLDGPGQVPDLRTYLLHCSAINVCKIAQALATKRNYLEALRRVMVGANARTSVNGHMGRSLGKILEMTERRHIEPSEMQRLSELVARRGHDAVHVELCKFHPGPDGCRFGEDCTQWHSEVGLQAMADNDDL